MKSSIGAVVVGMLVLSGCERGVSHEPTSVVLQPSKGEPVTLQIPRGYIEEPKDPAGPLPHVVLRIAASDFPGAEAFRPESEIRMLIEANSGTADAARKRQSAALIRPKPAEDAIVKSKELSKPGQIGYSFPNGKGDAEAYYLTSASGDVFAECLKSVCKAYKTWKKRIHVRFDYRPVQGSDVRSVDASIDRMLQSFAADASTAK
jgi:hypothetical protein